MKLITTLFLSSVLTFTALSQISTNGVYIQDGITTEVGKQAYEIITTNNPTLIYFSNDLIVKINTNSDFFVNNFFQDVLNNVDYPQKVIVGDSVLNMTLLKGSSIFSYNIHKTNSSCVISTPYVDVELYQGLFYIEVSDTKVIVAVLDGSMKSYNGKKESIINKGQAIIAEPNDIGILEDKVIVKPGKINESAMKKLISHVDDINSLRLHTMFIRINGKTIGVDK